MMLTTMDVLNEGGHLVVALSSQPQVTFEVTEVTQQGTSLVLQCRPMGQGQDPQHLSLQDHTDRVFITDGDAEPLSFHDPRRFYEDLR